ncbi:GTP pyrophosphokinase [Vibrio phage JSF12]|uniref:GTP pyrophosphokinase n=2 Tax=Jesfedecavirus TaxID=2560156 RepID=A0A2D0Z166_9CAUD|nr:metal-dependent phosphohydrolase [Vibrio phage JSF10]YP_009794740.1 metal-dependent phosphohydrolase [Vibrio phage JSF12]ASV43373.1 GTP pyrophosphokinase [Vibrio phage JSF10]ASV43575.1 GTP pyrophosphokinase [Vibrio phage JSF12]
MLLEDLEKLYEVAYQLSKMQHKEQKYAGRCYFTAHILEVEAEVVRQMPLDLYRINDILKARIVSLLHDIVEDTPVTIEYIRESFGDEIATSVDYLTKSDKVPYETYIRRVSLDRLATIVKRCDALCNLRQSMITRKYGKVEKYLKVLEILAAGG